MTSRYRHRRTFDPAIAFPSPVEPGEIIVNTSNRQIAVGDANAGALGVPKALIGVRFFDTTARYALNDVVVQAGNLYKANATIPPGAFNGANWTQLGVVTTMPAGSVVFTPTGNVIAIDVQAAIAEVDAEKVAKAGDTMAGHLSLPTSPSAPNAVRKDYVDAADAAVATLAGGKVDKGGDTMSGALTLPADPTVPLHAATKQYVDANTGSALVVSDTPPAGAKDGSLWWESDSGLLYVRYNDGNTIQWVIAAPQPDINAFALKTDIAAQAVRYDTAQSLTAAQQQQARQNIYAAPFDAMAYSGLQINGGFEVNQEGVASSVNNKYFCDGWQLIGVGTMNVTATQVVTNIPGFLAQAQFTVSTAQASLGAGDYLGLQHFIEGWRCVRLGWGTANAQPLTISFWSAHHRTGIYSGAVRNKANNRTYTFTYTQAAADVAQYNTVTIPGDTTGTWTTDNTIGLGLYLMMACGSTYIAPAANTWFGATYAAAPGQINGVAATSDVFRLTGVTVLPGNEAPVQTRSPFVMRSYPEELRLCQRYFQWVPYHMYFQAGAVSTGMQTAIPFQVTMRANPTMGGIAPDPNCAQAASNNITNNFPTITPYGVSAQLVSAAAGPCYVAGYRASADARL
jgi:hypothetical protein